MSPAEGRGHAVDAVLLALLAALTATLMLQTVYQTLRLWDDRATLQARHAAQQTVLTDVDRVRAQLESLAGQTAILAAGGNANARQLQEQLRAQGVTIRPPAPPAP